LNLVQEFSMIQEHPLDNESTNIMCNKYYVLAIERKR